MTGDRTLVASPVMTANAHLTQAELRKVTTTLTFVAALALAAALAVISVVADAAVARRPVTAKTACPRRRRLFAGSVIAAVLFGVIGVALARAGLARPGAR